MPLHGKSRLGPDLFTIQPAQCPLEGFFSFRCRFFSSRIRSLDVSNFLPRWGMKIYLDLFAVSDEFNPYVYGPFSRRTIMTMLGFNLFLTSRCSTPSREAEDQKPFCSIPQSQSEDKTPGVQRLPCTFQDLQRSIRHPRPTSSFIVLPLVEEPQPALRHRLSRSRIALHKSCSA